MGETKPWSPRDGEWDDIFQSAKRSRNANECVHNKHPHIHAGVHFTRQVRRRSGAYGAIQPLQWTNIRTATGSTKVGSDGAADLYTITLIR